ncbi:MAG TPA: FAD-linked oxidase C-terminal domain-containing protein [Polyangiaceae bacterium]|nr:FAD-linked oxidase C-terminal domain-containing protein [Polyangiaceae bacterium]
MLAKRFEHARPTPGAIDRARSLLDRALGPSKVLTGRAECEPYAADDSDIPGLAPDAVVLAESPDDIARALEVAEIAEVPLTPRLAGSGRTGGAVPVAGGIVLVTLGMAKIKEIDRDERLAVVEPGVITGDLHDAVEREGLFYPPDPNSLKMCAIGGNVAENAGGPRAFKYGVTRDYVLGLEAILMGGTRVRTGKRTVKGVTGYDVTALLTGSEGTLAVFSEATLRLIEKPPEVATLLALFVNVRAAGLAVSAIVARGLVPRCLEMLDSGTLAALRTKGVPIDTRAGALLLIEVDGDAHACEVGTERIGEACMDQGAIDVLVAQDAAQRARLWVARREMSPAVRALARHKLSEDVVVPRQKIADLLDQVARTSEATGIRTVTYGHAGDGNLHVNFLWNEPDEVPRVERSIEQLFRDVVAMRGTLSGEHGIGLAKAPYLRLEQSDALIDLQVRLKGVFDPKGLLNPGKIFPVAGHRAC